MGWEQAIFGTFRYRKSKWAWLLYNEEFRERNTEIAQQLQVCEMQDRAVAIEEIYGIVHRLGVPLNDRMGDMGRQAKWVENGNVGNNL